MTVTVRPLVPPHSHIRGQGTKQIREATRGCRESRWGFRKLHDRLRLEGCRINNKRLHVSGCHRPAYRSQAMIGMLEPVGDRRNGARA